MSIVNIEKHYCLVCNIESNSIHNGVNSCRACSAFFRRGVYIYKHFRCRRGNKNCVIKPGSKLFCKYCRFQKCKEVGMILRKINIDLFNNSPTQSYSNDEIQVDDGMITSSSSNEEIQLDGDIIIENNKVFYDMKGTIDHVNKVFSSTISSLENLNSYTTCLQRMSKGLNILFINLNFNHPEKCSFTNIVQLERVIKNWQNFITFLPNILMVLEEFATFSFKDKWIIFRNFWRQCQILLTQVYLTKIKNYTNEALIVCDNKHVIKINDIEFVNPYEDKHREQFSLMKPTLMFLHKFIYLPMKNNNYDEIEIAYLVVYLMFDRLTLDNTTKECQKIGEEIIKIINSEIHNYYIFNKKMYDYAYRITELTNLVPLIREYSNRQKDINLISTIMNYLDLSIFNNI